LNAYLTYKTMIYISQIPNFYRFLHATIVVSLAMAASHNPSNASDELVDFNRDIRPLLSDNCFHCHGPDANTREADLRLDVETDAKADLGGYFAIKDGDTEKSELIERLFTDDEDLLMPPPESEKRLSPEQKELFKRWIAQGAKWSKHWAYVAPTKHPVPNVDQKWSQHWIDQFVLKKLKEKQISPNGKAEKVTLLRRVYFDLTGLPPTAEDVDAFLVDKSENAFETVVAKLLKSEHFGERMAVYWLDLVRYADTVGYHGDQDHNISPYRDWVISAFNSNMPFDQFTREQLAGDLLENPTESQLVATGYNRLLQTTHEGGLQVAEYRAVYAADRVRNLSAVWMGGTLGCAQCHDHKYDPYTAKDFYSMAAFFDDIDDEEHFRNGTNSLPTRRNPELIVLTQEQRAELEELNKRLAAIQTKMAKLSNRPESKTALTELEKQKIEVENLIATLNKSGRPTMIVRTLAEPRKTKILPRGNFLDESGAVVSPAIPDFLKAIGRLNGESQATRLDLANWLTDTKSESGLLTARVFVNRMWYLLFGKGLTPNLDDFGGQGQPPIHPELLDNLAIEFVNSGWDVKKLIETIVLSRTYQSSSITIKELQEKDPENIYFARQSHVRLPAEFIRDNALAVSGLLIKKVGGGSVKPYQPPGYYRNLNFPMRKYSHHADQRQYQRGVYVHWQRQFLHPMLKAFDAPRREECTAERSKSNTPIAALVLLNDPTFVESAIAFAENVSAKQLAKKEAIVLAFEIAMSRSPDEFETKALTQLYDFNLEAFKKDEAAAEKSVTVGMRTASKEHNVVQLAALTQVVRAIFNLDEFVSRR